MNSVQDNRAYTLKGFASNFVQVGRVGKRNAAGELVEIPLDRHTIAISKLWLRDVEDIEVFSWIREEVKCKFKLFFDTVPNGNKEDLLVHFVFTDIDDAFRFKLVFSEGLIVEEAPTKCPL